MISALHGGCELIYPLGMVMDVHAGVLRRDLCGLALGASQSACGRRMWKNISVVGVRILARHPAQGRHIIGLSHVVLSVIIATSRRPQKRLWVLAQNPDLPLIAVCRTS